MNLKKLAASLEEVSRYHAGEIGLKVTEVIPPPVNVKIVRARTGLSQRDFASEFGFSTAAVRNWEQGLREPEGPARTLLALIESNPKLMQREIRKLRSV